MGISGGPYIVRDSSLVLELDAADKNSYIGSGTTWRDLSGNNKNAILKNSPFFSSTNGGQFSLDGTDDYFYVSGAFTSYTNFTMIAWVKVMTIDLHRGIFAIKNATDTSDFNSGNFAIHTFTGGYFGMEAGNLYAGNTSKNNTVVNGTIAQCTVVCNQSNLLVTYYLNGIADGTQAITSTITFSDHNALFIGCRQYSLTGENNGQNVLTGNIYNISFYNRALSATEIFQNYNEFKTRFTPPTPPPPIITSDLALHLDVSNITSYPGSGTTWSDISGNNRNFNWVSTPTRGTDAGVPYFTTLGNRCIGPASNSFGINNTSGFTIFIVFKQIALSTNHAFKFYTTTNGRAIAPHLAWNDGNIYYDTTPGRVQAASGGTSNWNVFVFTRNGSLNTLYKNENVLASGTLAGNLDLISTAVDLGSSDEYGGNSSLWNARLASFLVYNRGLSNDEIIQNVNFLKYQFNI